MVFVYVADADGNMHGFGPGDDVPVWAAAKIENPDVWAADAQPDGEDLETADVDGFGGEGVAGALPPKAGPKATREVWCAYATMLGFDVEEGTSRDQIIQAVEEWQAEQAAAGLGPAGDDLSGQPGM